MSTVYYFENPVSLTDRDIEQITRFMPAARKKQYERCIRRVRCEGAACFALLVHAMRQRGLPYEALEFTYGHNGKPYTDGFFFNFSHCPECAVCAVSGAEIGVDVQKKDDVSAVVKERYCTEAERRLLDSGMPFKRLWTQKEAMVKYSGEGIGALLSLPDLSPYTQNGINMPLNGKYFYSDTVADCAFSVYADEPTERIIRVGYEELLHAVLP